MSRLLNSPGFLAVMFLALIGGIGLLILSEWVQPLREGEHAVLQGALEEGVEHFAAAEERFDQLPVMKQILPRAYAASLTNQLRILYRLGDFDALLDRAASSPSRATVHFWAGCALFNRAAGETEKKARLALLRRASDEFRSALEIEPDDWDTKYNFELSERLIAELREEPETPPMELLRPKPREGEQPSRPAG